MTKDEEMAEEYADKECCQTCTNTSHTYKEKCECWSFARKGFLTGRLKWHKVADGDLPKENKRYLCKIKGFVGSGISYECFDYDTEYSSWKNACGDVIEWQEIYSVD